MTAASPPGREADSPPAAARSILVVDDSAVQRQHAVRLCLELGASEVHEARHGREALEVLNTLDALPNLIIVDLEMPEMDGIELIETLQQRGLRIPIVLLSGMATRCSTRSSPWRPRWCAG